MNKTTYAKFYDYGSTAFSNESQDSEFHLIRYENFQIFLDENPSVIPLDKEIHCQTHLRDCGQWRCYTASGCQIRCGDLNVWDHMHGMRLKGVSKSHFVATHPYGDRVENALENKDLSKCILEGLLRNYTPSTNLGITHIGRICF